MRSRHGQSVSEGCQCGGPESPTVDTEALVSMAMRAWWESLQAGPLGWGWTRDTATKSHEIKRKCTSPTGSKFLSSMSRILSHGNKEEYLGSWVDIVETLSLEPGSFLKISSVQNRKQTQVQVL